MFNDFLLGLQFLSRLRLSGELFCDEDGCGRSVRSMASKSPRTSSQRQPRGHSSQSSRAPRV